MVSLPGLRGVFVRTRSAPPGGAAFGRKAISKTGAPACARRRSGFILLSGQRMYPLLRAQKIQNVRVSALNTVVVTQTLPVRTPLWPIWRAMT